jgi:hypothetical protein
MRSPFFCLMVLFTVATLATYAQQEPVMIRPQLMPFKKIAPIVLPVKPAGDSTAPKLSLVNSLYIKKWYDAAVPVDSVSMGKVYRMPFDNMLCLVPDEKKNSRMPVKKITRMPEPMPNAFRRRGMNR